jgi:Lrp/AsnC family transcriptional regulator of ectoine degradation
MSQIKLDKRDLHILSVLSREGRITKSELAARVNLSATPCWERLKRLEEAGIITGYRAEVELRKIAPHVTVFVVAEVESHRAERLRAFEEAMADYDEITSCWALGGGFDYLLQIVTRDIDSYQRLIDRILASGLGLSRYFTYIVTKPVKQVAPLPELLLGTPEE